MDYVDWLRIYTEWYCITFVGEPGEILFSDKLVLWLESPSVMSRVSYVPFAPNPMLERGGFALRFSDNQNLLAGSVRVKKETKLRRCDASDWANKERTRYGIWSMSILWIADRTWSVSSDH